MRSVSRLLAVLATVLTAMPASAAAMSRSQGARPARASGTSTIVTLVTGDRLVVTSSQARRVVAVVPAERAEALISVTIGATSYEFPSYALAYLGRGLDPRLFSLNALRSSEVGGRIPIQIGYIGRVPRLAGVTITRAAGDHATGYLTYSSAKLFGATLARQFATDRRRGGFGADGIFGAGVSIGLAGDAGRTEPASGQVSLVPAARLASASRAPRTRVSQHTLTFRADDALGQPVNGTGGVFLVSLDNSIELEASATFTGGVARFTVPAGRYFAFASFDDTVGQLFAGLRVVVVPEITVHANVTVRTDERAARSMLTMVTPRPALPRETAFEVHRSPAAGPLVAIGAHTFEAPIRVATTRRPPRIGKLQTFVEQRLGAPPTAKSPYHYMLAYQDLSGIIGPQRRVIRPAGLATIRARFTDATLHSGLVSWTGDYPAEVGDGEASFLLANSTDLRLPSRLTEYFTAAPSLAWTIFLQGSDFSLLQDDVRRYRPGSVVTENWNAAPLHPAPDVRVPGAALPGPLVASATRSGNTLAVLLTPFTDNIPGHLGSGFEFQSNVSGRFAVDVNGQQVASGDAAASAIWQAKLRARSSLIRFVLDTERGAKLYHLATRSHTVWTWRSATRPGATLPPGWTCPSMLVTNSASRRCAAQPLLALEYRVANLSLTESVPAGRQSVTIFVSHFQPSDHGPRIASVRVRVSFDDGRTWRTATVRRTAPSRFVATYTGSASARFVSLDVSAADASGSAINETLIRAYQLAS